MSAERRHWLILAMGVAVVVLLAVWPGPLAGSARPVVLAQGQHEELAGGGHGRYLVLVVSDRSLLQTLATRVHVAPEALSPQWRLGGGDPRQSSSDAAWTAEDAWVASQRLLARKVGATEYLTVLQVSPGSEFDQAGLAVGDRIVAVDGAPMSAAAFWMLVMESPQLPVQLTVSGGRGTRTVALPGRRDVAAREGLVVDGHAVATRAHRRALVPVHEQGPSSGLITALALVDATSAGSLSGGRVVAGTGEIDTEGRVWPVGAVAVKARAARAAGADILLVPRGSGARARAALGGAIPVHEVSSVRDAVLVLCRARGAGAACAAAEAAATRRPASERDGE